MRLGLLDLDADVDAAGVVTLFDGERRIGFGFMSALPGDGVVFSPSARQAIDVIGIDPGDVASAIKGAFAAPHGEFLLTDPWSAPHRDQREANDVLRREVARWNDGEPGRKRQRKADDDLLIREWTARGRDDLADLVRRGRERDAR